VSELPTTYSYPLVLNSYEKGIEREKYRQNGAHTAHSTAYRPPHNPNYGKARTVRHTVPTNKKFPSLSQAEVNSVAAKEHVASFKTFAEAQNAHHAVRYPEQYRGVVNANKTLAERFEFEARKAEKTYDRKAACVTYLENLTNALE